MEPDLPEVNAALKNWPDAVGAKLQRLTSANSYSASILWHVSLPGGDRLLKRCMVPLPFPESKDEWIVNSIVRPHAFQNHLAEIEPLLIARLFASGDGKTLVLSRGGYWQMEKWLPGAANFSESPSEDRVIAAAKALARLHMAAASFYGIDLLDAVPGHRGPAHTLDRRLAQCRKFLGGGLIVLADQLNRFDDTPATTLLKEAARLIAPQLPALTEELARACKRRFDARWVLGDVWYGNVLFSGAEVTGFVDLAGARVGVQAADLARLLGSMVGDGRERWLVGMAAYESVRPLPLEELLVIDLLRRSEVVLSAANWLKWLSPPEPRPAEWGRREWRRLESLVGRMRTLRRWDEVIF